MDRIEINGGVYVAKEQLNRFPISGGGSCPECRGCAFNTDGMLETCACLTQYLCTADERKDGRDIIWVEE